jgi:hypothetical protein
MFITFYDSCKKVLFKYYEYPHFLSNKSKKGFGIGKNHVNKFKMMLSRI